MPGLDPGLLELKGARAETRYVSLATIKFLSGLMTQRSPFAGIDTRYGTRFFGGRPDALLAGSNCEISNKLTLKRRPGLVAYGTTSIPAPLTFFDWQEVNPFSLSLLVDTTTAIYTYSPTNAGIYLKKAAAAGQTNFIDLVNTLYLGDGVDLFKIVGPNLLTQSNTFTNAAWTKNNATLTVGQVDPNGGTTATQVVWGVTGATASLTQLNTPNVTPVGSNTFTFSVWAKQTGGAESITIFIQNQAGTTIGSLVVALTTTWTRYQVTATMGIGDTSVQVAIGSPTATTAIVIYGAQLEVGGPAKPTEITTTKAQGVYNWGIMAPVTAPTLSFALAGPARWLASHAYVVGNQVTDSNGNLETVTVIAGTGTSGATEPVWATTRNSTTVDNAGANQLTWRNDGPSGLSPKTGYQYYYAFLNSTTGQPSNASPTSATTGPLIGQSVTVSGARSTDPQVDSIAIYRNADGGAFFFQLTTIANPAAGTWSFVDTTQDTGLNTLIFAPLGLLNSPPPAGALDPVFHAARGWVHVGSTLYYSAGPDNAAALNITLNAVSMESWPALNTIPFDAPLTRKLSTSAGLLVWTTNDLWIVTGSDLTSFNPVRLLAGHGLRSWNALDVDGSTIYAYLSDRELISLNPNTGSLEIGFPIGDQLEATFDPTKVYLARHVAGSQDNAVYFADGSTGWFRVNPHQVGASAGGEQAPVWSPKAAITGGAGAVASVETSPGVFQLLVGGTGTGPVLTRSLTTFQDNGTSYPWSATIGSVVLATAGMLAEAESITTEMTGSQATVNVLLDEISGTFEALATSVSDPPQLAASVSLLSNRFYLSQGAVPPLCRHLQIRLDGAAVTTQDELLSLSIRGALVPEQT